MVWEGHVAEEGAWDQGKANRPGGEKAEVGEWKQKRGGRGNGGKTCPPTLREGGGGVANSFRGMVSALPRKRNATRVQPVDEHWKTHTRERSKVPSTAEGSGTPKSKTTEVCINQTNPLTRGNIQSSQESPLRKLI